MCGRYAMAQEYEKLQRRFGFRPEKYAPTPRYNVTPGQTSHKPAKAKASPSCMEKK